MYVIQKYNGLQWLDTSIGNRNDEPLTEDSARYFMSVAIANGYKNQYRLIKRTEEVITI